jgi:hypothetical protein
MNIWVLFIDPDNGELEDVACYAFSTKMAASRVRNELIENGCESVLSLRELRVSDQWAISSDGNHALRFAGDGLYPPCFDEEGFGENSPTPDPRESFEIDSDPHDLEDFGGRGVEPR